MKKFSIVFAFMVWGTFIQAQQITATTTTGCAPLLVEFTSNVNQVETYHWTFSNGISSSLSNPTILFELSGDYDVTLMVVYSDSRTESFVFTKFISVSESPVVDFEIVNPQTCLQEPISFVNKSINAAHYFWDFGDGTSSSEVNPEHIYAESGTYSVALLASYGENCSSTKVLSEAITVKTVLPPAFVSTEVQVCNNNTEITFIPFGDFSSWLWNFGDGTTSSLEQPNHAYNDKGKYSVTLTATTLEGCSVTLEKNEYIEVQALPEISPSVSEQLICKDGSSTFSLSNSGQIKWKFTDGLELIGKNITRSFENVGIYGVEISIDGLECYNSQFFENIIEVKSAQTPTVIPFVDQGCVPFEIKFENSTKDATSYKWELDGKFFTGRILNYNIQQPGYYTLKAITTHASGCESTLILDSAVVANRQQVKASASTVIDCIPLETELSLSANDVSNVIWNLGDGRLIAEKTPTVVFPTKGKYDVSVSFINKYGCESELTLMDAIHAKDTLINFSALDTVSVCINSEIAFIGDMGNEFWRWDFGDATFSNDPNPKHAYIQSGDFIVSLTTKNDNGCSTTISPYNIVSVENVDVNFSYAIEKLYDCPDFEYSFHANLSNVKNWEWNFHDGTVSTEQNVIHQFSGNGQFMASLKATGNAGCTSQRTTIIQAPWKYCTEEGEEEIDDPAWLDSLLIIYKHAPFEVCSLPFELAIQNPIAHAYKWNAVGDVLNRDVKTIKYQWDFGDGNTSSEVSPTYSYSNPGLYIINLIWGNSKSGYDTLSDYMTIKIDEPIVDFDFSSEASCNGFDVSFNADDASIPISWEFGDILTSTEPDPIVQYANEGVFQVILTAQDSIGCQARVAKNVVVGNPYFEFNYPKSICLGETMSIAHNIEGYERYVWNYGREQERKFPEFIFDTIGDKEITLTAIDKQGCESVFVLPVLVTVSDPVANFVGETYGCNSHDVKFKNLSKDANSWWWDFGNGLTSTSKAPTTTYTPGTYSVMLVANKGNCTDTLLFENYIHVDAFEANFTYEKTGDCLPQEVAFNDDTEGAIKWHWQFGDGETSEEQAPRHIYNLAPLNEIILTVTNANGCISEKKFEKIGFFQSEITVNKTTGCMPFMAEFDAVNEKAVSWNWDFGDGTSSDLKNPAHLYQKEGDFTIYLITKSSDGCYDTLIQNNYIQVEDVRASFDKTTVGTGCTPLNVSFSNTSYGGVKYLWNFGDDVISSQKDPIHVYTKVGNIDVSLIVENKFGCTDTVKYENFITTRNPQTNFTLSDSSVCNPQTVQFTDSSVAAVKWKWLFGNGETSEEQHPSYIYPASGRYKVSLITTDQYGCFDYLSFDSLRVVSAPKVKFSYAQESSCVPSQLHINNESSVLEKPVYLWDFGDGTYSNEPNPSKVFTAPGKYNVSLKVENDALCLATFNSKNEINVYDTFKIVAPEVKRLGITEDNKIEFDIKAISQNNLKYHLIYRKELTEMNYKVVDTISDASTILYSDRNVRPDQMAYMYKIQSHAFCNIPAELDDLKTYSTMYLNSKSTDNGIALNWSGYAGHNFENYRVLRKNNNQEWVQLIQIPVAQTYYIDTEDLCMDDYQYKVEAELLEGLNYCSNSNVVENTPVKDVFLDQEVVLVRTTVEDNFGILTEWLPPEIGADKVEYYRLWKTENNIAFTLVAEIPKGITSYLDTNVDVERVSYQYKIDVINTCDALSKLSNGGSSILLKKQAKNAIYNIDWLPYKGWKSGVKEYYIQRKNEYGEWETVKVVPPEQTKETINLDNDN